MIYCITEIILLGIHFSVSAFAHSIPGLNLLFKTELRVCSTVIIVLAILYVSEQGQQ